MNKYARSLQACLFMAVFALVGVTLTGASSALPPAGRLIAQGKVTISGKAASGVQVDVYAWPTSSVLGKLKVGQSVPWQLVGSAKTTSDGAYEVTVSSPAALTSSADINGYVNLEVDAGTASWSFSRRLAITNGVQALAKPNTDMNTTAAASPEITDLQATGPETCDTVPTLVKKLGKNWATVGQSYSTLRKVTHWFTYTKHQDSSLGVGVSSSGNVGTFHLDGTWSQSSTATQGFPSFHESNVLYQTEFDFGKFLRYCPALHIPKTYTVHVIGWAGGSNMLHPKQAPSTSSKNCVNETRGSSFSTNNTAAVEWSKGLNIPAISFEGSAQTGYDTSAAVNFVFGTAGRLCGTHDVPGGGPRQLVARHR